MAKYTSENKNVILVDLTIGEMGTNGNPEIRKMESQNAAKILNVSERLNLYMEDRFIELSKKNIFKIVELIRKYRPTVIMYPFGVDYHPDHEATNRIVREAIHTSGLLKYKNDYDPFRPQKSYQYYINHVENPSRYVDISDYYDIKQNALSAHISQFDKGSGTAETYLNTGFIESVKIRDQYWGHKCGCQFAEVLYTDQIAKLEL